MHLTSRLLFVLFTYVFIMYASTGYGCTIFSPVEKEMFLFDFVLTKEYCFWHIFREQHLVKYYLEIKPHKLIYKFIG